MWILPRDICHVGGAARTFALGGRGCTERERTGGPDHTHLSCPITHICTYRAGQRRVSLCERRRNAFSA